MKIDNGTRVIKPGAFPIYSLSIVHSIEGYRKSGLRDSEAVGIVGAVSLSESLKFKGHRKGEGKFVAGLAASSR